MATVKLETGVVHRIPKDLRTALMAAKDLPELWNDLTPLARNEWICWVTMPKKAETRPEHIKRLQEELRAGKRRPCCWPGCPHRNPNTKKWFKNNKGTKKS